MEHCHPKSHTCAVKGCRNKFSPRHRFPNPKKYMELFKKWIVTCGNEKIFNLDPERVYKSYRICHVHFAENDVGTNFFLKRTAVPSLNLPVNLKDVTTEEAFQLLPNVLEPVASGSGIQPVASGSGIESVASESKMEIIALGDAEKWSDLQMDAPTTPPREHIGVKEGTSILKSIGYTRTVQLTPRKTFLYKKVRHLQKRNISLKIRYKKTQTKVKLFKHMSKEEIFNEITDSLDSGVAQFMRTQLLMAGRKKHGRRFTLNDKILGLILYKQSPKAYKLLTKIFVLPSRTTLKQVLRTLSIHAVFTNLQNRVVGLQDIDRKCILMFDEMAIQPSIHFLEHLGEICGFEDLGDTKSSQIADTVLVFMLHGINRSWKQPLCYFFSKSAVKTFNLVRLIKLVINKCHEVGLQLVATVSDQGTTNQAAIQYLINETKISSRSGIICNENGYRVGDNTIHHIYDPPHLLKGVRNNLLTKNLFHKQADGHTAIATWSDISTAYAIDNESGDLRAMPKLTDWHVLPSKIKKMKVSCASQVLSHTVASVIALFAKSGITSASGAKLENRAIETAEILSFFDKLFDSVNGTTLVAPPHKPLKCALSQNSEHFKFWDIARTKLQSMYFQKFRDTSVARTPSIVNWIKTLNSLQQICKTLRKNSNITFIRPRFFNQDPLENFFGQIRQHGHRSINPTAVHFENHFKTLLLNNFVTRHSIGSNCETEDSSHLIKFVKEFVMVGRSQECTVINRDYSNYNVDLSNISYRSYIDKISLGYVSGWLIKNVKQLTLCAVCRSNLLCSSSEKTEWHSLVVEKDFSECVPQKLKYCHSYFLEKLFLQYDIIKKLLPLICHEKDFLYILTQEIKRRVIYNFNECIHKDNLIDYIIIKFSKLCIHNWCTGVNRLLLGKDARIKRKDKIYEQATDMYIKRRKKV